MNGYVLGAVAGVAWLFLSSLPTRVVFARAQRKREAQPIPVIRDLRLPVLTIGPERPELVEELLSAYELVVGHRWLVGKAMEAEPLGQRRIKLEELLATTAERAHRFRRAVLEGMSESGSSRMRAVSSDELADRAYAMLGMGEHASVLDIIRPHEAQLENPRLMIAYAAALRRNNERARAVELLTKQLETAPLADADRLQLAKIRANYICDGPLGSHSDAVSAANSALAIASNDAQALHLRALVDVKFGTFTPEGTTAGQRAVTLEPANAQYLHVAMCIARRTKDTAAARDYAHRVLALESPRAQLGIRHLAHVILSESASRRGRMFKASAHLRQVVQRTSGPLKRIAMRTYLGRWISLVNSFCFASGLWIALLALAPIGPIPTIAAALIPLLAALTGAAAVRYVAGPLSIAEIGRAIHRTMPSIQRVSALIAIISTLALTLCFAADLSRPSALAVGLFIVSGQLLWAGYVRARNSDVLPAYSKHRATKPQVRPPQSPEPSSAE